MNGRYPIALHILTLLSRADELMVISWIFDHGARKKSYSLLAGAFGLTRQAA